MYGVFSGGGGGGVCSHGLMVSKTPNQSCTHSSAHKHGVAHLTSESSVGTIVPAAFFDLFDQLAHLGVWV